MPAVRTNFRPGEHGFHFINSFELSLFPARTPARYGLGPGICLTALDYFYSRVTIPNIRDAKDVRTNYLSHLFRRSLSVYSLSSLRKQNAWMGYPPGRVWEKLSKHELPLIVDSIDQGLPVPLLLVAPPKTGIPTQCVLAIAYEIRAQDQDMHIYVYDPNFPDQTMTLDLQILPAAGGFRLRYLGGQELLGFYHLDYHPQPPPTWEMGREAIPEAGKADETLLRLENRGMPGWADTPIEKPQQDRFDYQAYARVLGGRITGPDTPLTIGIFGPWGSGKTSLMQLLQAGLPREFSPGAAVRTIWVDAWTLSSQDEVWQAFMQALFNAVNRKLSIWERIDKKKFLLQTLANSYRLGLALVPWIVGVFIGVPKADWATILAYFQSNSMLGNTYSVVGAILSGLVSLWAILKPIIEKGREVINVDIQKTLKYASYSAKISELTQLQRNFSRLVEVLVGKQGRLVIFIDDLDRCTPDKIPEILEAIKLFATTPNCVYVLGLDYDVVRSGIQARYQFKADEEAASYLEKIVQIPFYLPPLNRYRIAQFLEEYYPDLAEISATAPEVFSQGLEANPRQVKRAVNIYRTLVALSYNRFIDWEIDYLNHELVAKIVVLQSRFNLLYAHLTQNPKCILDLEDLAQQKKLDQNDLQGSEMGDLLLGNEKHGRPAMMNPDELPSLQNLFTSGRHLFNSPYYRDHLEPYIYLTAVVESGAYRPGQASSGSEEQGILLGGDAQNIHGLVEKILARAGQDAPLLASIRKNYLARLDNVLRDPIRYPFEQRLSALLALIDFERWDERIEEFPGGEARLKMLDTIRRRGLANEAFAALTQQYFERVARKLLETTPPEKLSEVQKDIDTSTQVVDFQKMEMLRMGQPVST